MGPYRSSVFMLVLVLMVGLDSSGREPIKSPAPVKQLGEVKVVRARDLGVPFDGTPGKLNSITDVPGVEVGYTTLIRGEADTTGYWWSLPVVAETWDGWLNDINGFHIKPEDIFYALDTAHGGAIEEGSVGGGTGMICYEFKGGNGTASRVVSVAVAGGGDPGA